jgi:hypothetical protein
MFTEDKDVKMEEGNEPNIVGIQLRSNRNRQEVKGIYLVAILRG